VHPISITIYSSSASNYIPERNASAIADQAGQSSGNLVLNYPPRRGGGHFSTRANGGTPFERLEAIKDNPYAYLLNREQIIVGQVLGSVINLEAKAKSNATFIPIAKTKPTSFSTRVCVKVDPSIRIGKAFTKFNFHFLRNKPEHQLFQVGVNVDFDGKTLCSDILIESGEIVPVATLRIIDGSKPEPITVELASEKVGQLKVYWTHKSQDLAPSQLSLVMIRQDPSRNNPVTYWSAPQRLGSSISGSHVFESLQPADEYKVYAVVKNLHGSVQSNIANVTIASIALPPNSSTKQATCSMVILIITCIITLLVTKEV